MNNDPLLEEDTITFSESTDDTSNVHSDDLTQINSLGKELNNLDNRILEKEAEISNLKQARKRIAEELIPELMGKHGLKLIQLDDETKIRVDDFVDARIKDPSTAFKWLEDTNNDSIIKNQITINLGLGDNALVKQIEDKLKEEFGVASDNKITVHHATLKSFCRDALENPELAESLPREAFGIYEGKRAKITRN